MYDAPDRALYRIRSDFYWHADAQVSAGSASAMAHTYSWYNTGSSVMFTTASSCEGGPASPNGN